MQDMLMRMANTNKHILSPIFSLVVLRNFCRYYLEMTEKAYQAVFFCLGKFRTFRVNKFDFRHMLGGVFVFIFI
jgi:hypothetical protein